MDLYGQYRFDTVILDEAQYISNPRTKNAQAVKLLNCRQRFALSGTPIENNLTELWSIYDFLLPGYLYSHSYFSAVYERAIIKEQDEAVISALPKTRAAVFAEAYEKRGAGGTAGQGRTCTLLSSG